MALKNSFRTKTDSVFVSMEENAYKPLSCKHVSEGAKQVQSSKTNAI